MRHPPGRWRRPVWAQLLVLFLLLVVFDGVLRKWVLPGMDDLLYVAKDGVLAFACLLVIGHGGFRWPVGIRTTALPIVLGLYATWATVEMFNPALPNMAVAIFGFRSHLLYVTLLFMVPMWLASTPDWERTVRRYVIWVVSPVLLVGIYQFFQPLSHWVNQYVDVERASGGVVGVGGRPRITGTFSYISGMSSFAIFNACLAYGLVFTGLRGNRRLLWWGTGLLTALAVVAPMTGSRGAVFFPVVAAAAVVLVGMGRRDLNFRFGVVAVLAVVGLSAAHQTRLSEGWGIVVERTEQADDELHRAELAVVGPIEKAEVAGLVGYGTGSAHQAAPQLVPGARSHDWLPTRDFEGEAERVALELGVVGLVLYAGLKLTLLWLALIVFWRAATIFELFCGTVSFAYFVASFLDGIVYSPTTATFHWISAGLMAAAWSRQWTRRLEAAPAAAAP